VVFLALNGFAYMALTLFLLFGVGVVVAYTFSLVRHAKSLAADAKKAGERLNEAARDIQAQVDAMADRREELERHARPGKRRPRV
jgi:hypothetical protein